MNKLAKLFQLAETFYQNAMRSLAQIQSAETFTMPDDPEEDTSGPSGSGNLSADAEQYDIKDEELFNQFESFMSAYNELVESLSINPEHLTEDAMQESAQLIDVLNTRYERIMSNPYLNMGEEGWEEDFDPGQFTSFIQRVVKDAESKLQTIAGEDISINEMRAAQFAQEFNQQMVDRGDKNITYTGNKVQQLLEARRTWFKNLMFIKKVGKSHPQYERFERYIAGRHKAYQTIMADPERKASYRAKAKDRQATFRNKLILKKKELLEMLARVHDPKKKAEIQAELEMVEKGLQARKEKGKELALKEKALKSAEGYEGALERLRVKTKTQTSEIVKKIKAKAASDPYFDQYKQAVRMAKERMDKEPSPASQAALQAAITAEAEALKKYLNEAPVVVQVRHDVATLYDFREKVKALTQAEAVSDENKSMIHQLISEGEQLIVTYGKVYRAPISAVSELVKLLRAEL